MRASPIIFYKGGNTYGKFETYREVSGKRMTSPEGCSRCVFNDTDHCVLAPCHGGLFVKVAKDDDALLLAILRGEV